MHRRIASALVIMLVTGVSSGARAESALRCGTQIVELGASMKAVEAACGPPTSATTESVVPPGKGPKRRLEFTTWVYDLGHLQFTRTLVFLGDVLQSIRVGGYGE